MRKRRAGPSAEPLSPTNEKVLSAWIAEALGSLDERLQYEGRVVATFYYLGMHPSVLADPAASFLRSDGAVAEWSRTKTGQAIRFPLGPELRAWFKPWIESLPHRNRRTYWRILHNVGSRLGFHLSPRASRHDLSSRLMEKVSFNTARQLTGTTERVLLDYGRRAASKPELERIAREGSG